MINTKEVRAKLSVSYKQIHYYRKAGLFPFEPIAVSYGDLWHDRVYPEEALTVLEILEGLRKRGFGLKKMRVLFATLSVTKGTRGFIKFDQRAQLVIDPGQLERAKSVVEAVIKSYGPGCRLPPKGEQPFGKG